MKQNMNTITFIISSISLLVYLILAINLKIISTEVAAWIAFLGIGVLNAFWWSRKASRLTKELNKATDDLKEKYSGNNEALQALSENIKTRKIVASISTTVFLVAVTFSSFFFTKVVAVILSFLASFLADVIYLCYKRFFRRS
jgi:hypothetical protein